MICINLHGSNQSTGGVPSPMALLNPFDGWKGVACPQLIQSGESSRKPFLKLYFFYTTLPNTWVVDYLSHTHVHMYIYIYKYNMYVCILTMINAHYDQTQPMSAKPWHRSRCLDASGKSEVKLAADLPSKVFLVSSKNKGNIWKHVVIWLKCTKWHQAKTRLDKTVSGWFPLIMTTRFRHICSFCL